MQSQEYTQRDYIPGAPSNWVLGQRSNGKWVAVMPMSLIAEFDSKGVAIANAKAKNPWLFTNA